VGGAGGTTRHAGVGQQQQHAVAVPESADALHLGQASSLPRQHGSAGVAQCVQVTQLMPEVNTLHCDDAAGALSHDD
jgi:hypothetical protein